MSLPCISFMRIVTYVHNYTKYLISLIKYVMNTLVFWKGNNVW
jgi:hypothetical protein